MTPPSRRCKITTILALAMLSTNANAQALTITAQTALDTFDQAPPVVSDNLAPDETLEMLDAPPEASQNINPTIPSIEPLNDNQRDELINAVKTPPKQANLQGQAYRLNRPELVQQFYQTQDYPFIWSLDNQLQPQAQTLLTLIQQSQEDGLNPAHYHSQILNNLPSILTPEERLNYELLLTDAYLTLAEHLANGIVDPKKTHREWNAVKVEPLELIANLSNAHLHQDHPQRLASFNANNARYQALKKQYNQLKKRLTQTPETSLPNLTLKLGMTHPAVGLLRQKLGLEGSNHYFDAELKQKLQHYQQHIGIDPDGVAGPATRALLNTTRQDLINQLAINLERQRWLPQDLGNPYVLVNIPSYQVNMIDNNQVIYHTKAVVGRTTRPTPAFTDRIRHVVMSPTWTVPPGIFKHDKLPQLRQNAAAFDGTYEAVAPNGKTLPPSAVNWHTSDATRYTLRQKPGRQNALGRIKFLFPNPHAIYLHDTPNKELFDRANRAYSSGCIRLQDPMDFADILLKNSQWTPEKIRAAANKSKESWVNPPNETPIYLVYWTTWADAQGQIKFAQDIYNLDNKLLKQYQQALNL